jgi:hypothetical protein
VTLAEHQLSTDIHVTNTSSSAKLEFQSLLHTYLAAPAKDVLIAPLQSLTYFDKVDPTSDGNPSQKLEARSFLDVKNPTDSVYEGAFIASSELTVSWASNSVKVRAKGFKDVVIWNPGEDGKKIGDMEEGGWYVPYARCLSQVLDRFLGTTMSVLSLATSVGLLNCLLVKHGSASKSSQSRSRGYLLDIDAKRNEVY